MGFLKAQVRLPSKTGASEDIVTNTWHFISAPTVGIEEAADHIRDVLAGFFYQPLASYFSSALGATQEIRVYDWGIPTPPHVPVIRSMAVTFGGAPTGNLPEEVAIVLTMHSGAPYTPRTRGRLYLGPLAVECLTSSETGPTRVSTIARTAITDRALTVMNDVGITSWATYSEVANDFNAVRGGFVDDAFDTQRRRGVDATARTEFGEPVPTAASLSSLRLDDGSLRLR